LGNNIVRRLAEQGKPIRAMVRDVEKAGKRLAHVKDKIEIVQGDVADRDGLKSLMRDVSMVIHLVAIALEKGGQTYEEVNYQGTINVVDAAKAAVVPRFIYMSQNGADPDHFSRFLRSKGRAQEYVVSSGLQWSTVRPSVIFGPQDEFFNSIARLVRLTPIIFPNIGGGTAQFQPVFVEDVAEAVARCVDDAGTTGKEFQLGGPEVLSMKEIEQRIFKAMGTNRFLIPGPTWLLRPAVFVMEKVLPGTPVSTTLLELLKVPNIVSDNALISYFNMQPRAFADENIAYLKTVTSREAIKRIFTGATVN
jgi:NADH dehydrogenase